MGRAVGVFVSRGVDEDEGSRDELNGPERDEDTGVDRDRVCRDEYGCREPNGKGKPADTGGAVSSDEMPDLRHVSGTGEPGTEESDKLAGSHDDCAGFGPGRVVALPMESTA